MSEQIGYALRPGVTCVTTPVAAVLLSPPHREKLTGLSPAQLAVLKALNTGPVTDPADDAAALVERLAAAGWLAVGVGAEPHRWYTVSPFAAAPADPAPTPVVEPAALSKFAVLHRDPAGFVLEQPLGWCDLHIHDAALLPLLDAATAPGVPDDVAARFRADLHRGGFLAGPDDAGFEHTSWSAPDLWFHRRSTLGPRTITWEKFGPTKWARGRFPQPPARPVERPGQPVPLPTPDLAALRDADPSLTAVLEDRVSHRAFDDAAPITVAQLAELLYRAARTRSTEPVGAGEELLSRPYPSAGGVYELEIYPVVRHVAGLPAGMYHYDSFDHVLRPVADIADPAVAQLIKPSAATLYGGAEPQVLLVIAARAGRVLWTYEQIGYAAILKDVGALMATLYLAGTAMGLGVCAQGFGDTAAFAAAAGTPELQQCSVGSVVVGSRPGGGPGRHAAHSAASTSSSLRAATSR